VTTFEGYCREHWHLSRPRAYQLIQAAQIVASGVIDNLLAVGNILSVSERQVRALVPHLSGVYCGNW
jgi:hypothetical protein